MNEIELSSEQKKTISMRLGIDLAGGGILLVGLLWVWLRPDQALVGYCIQAVALPWSAEVFLSVGSEISFRPIR